MWKKILSLMLAAALILSLGVSAFAAGDTASTELARVTLAVKNAVDIGNDYEEFNGNFDDDGPVRRWHLWWNNGMESVDVTAADDGKVLSYSYYSDSTAYYSYSEHYAPKFPATTYANAQSVADRFVNGVLGEEEGCQWSEASANTNLGASYYNFNGVLTKNGVPTEISIRVRVRVADSRVAYFYRSDAYGLYLPEVPSAEAKTTKKNADALLDGTVKLELQYVLDESGTNAVLRYVPQYSGQYIVDAQTGKLIDLDEVYAELNGGARGGMKNASAAEAEEAYAAADSNSGGAILTPVELEGIDKLEGVQDKETLDAYVRGYEVLGADENWSLRGAYYSKPDENDNIYCELVYYKTEDEYYGYKSVRLEARTSELQSMYTYDGSAIYDTEGDRDAMLATAETFLGELWEKEFARCALNENSSGPSFTFTRQENGVPYYGNSINASVDPVSGKLLSFYKNWDEDLTFAPKGKIVSMEQAVAAYADTFQTVLRYVNYPKEALPESNEPFLKAAADAGYTYVYQFKLAYRYDEGKGAYGVDAVTGEALCTPKAVSPKLSYSDLADSYAQKEVSALAEYGIGYAGGKLLPRNLVTQRELIGLLISATGVRITDGISDETADYLYSLAYGYGMLTEEERNDNAYISRGEMVRFLISATEYASAAKLNGIFQTGFVDDSDIPVQLKGYVAIAKGIGIVNGDSSGRFNPTKNMSRPDAALILYKFMSK